MHLHLVYSSMGKYGEKYGEIAWKASFELECCVIWVRVAAVLENGSNPFKQNIVWKNPTFWYICLLAWHTVVCNVFFFLKIGGRCTVLKVCSFLPSAQSFIPGLFCCFPPEERGTSKVLCKVSNPWSYFAQLLSSSFPVFSADVGSKWDYSWLKVS